MDGAAVVAARADPALPEGRDELVRTLVPTQMPEDDLFAGVREHLSDRLNQQED